MAQASRTSASLEMEFPDERSARVACDSLQPEQLLPKSTRCEARASVRKNVLCLEIDARDTAALRAAMNSFLRWVAVARDMTEVGSD